MFNRLIIFETVLYVYTRKNLMISLKCTYIIQRLAYLVWYGNGMLQKIIGMNVQTQASQ